jgi:predicted ArsR family transcriptional regulator
MDDIVSTSNDPVRAIAVLGEPTRRRIYELVTSRRDPVGREEVAKALTIGRELAAFHLDRLTAAGLLDVEYRRLTGRSGPGAGRPAKLYRRTRRDVAVSLPARDYERIAEVFADAIERLSTEDSGAAKAVEATIDEVARTRGRQSGAEARRKAGRRPGAKKLRAGLLEALGAAGYEPRTDPAEGTIRLENCPFHALSGAHRDLTCGMNLAWAYGVLDGLGDTQLRAELAPEPGYCCVTFSEATEATSEPSV